MKHVNSESILETERIYLKKLSPSDVKEDYVNWMNDKEVVRYTESRFKIHSKKDLVSYVERITNDPRYRFFAIVVKDKSVHIGNIKIGPSDQEHGFADVGIIIGKKAYYGKGLAAEAIKLIVDYAFNSLSLHKVTASCYAANLGSIKAFKKAGFKEEGRLSRHYLCEGQYTDKVCLGIINHVKTEE